MIFKKTIANPPSIKTRMSVTFDPMPNLKTALDNLDINEVASLLTIYSDNNSLKELIREKIKPYCSETESNTNKKMPDKIALLNCLIADDPLSMNNGLFLASKWGCDTAVSFFLDKKAEIEYQISGATPLYAATSFNHTAVVKILIFAQANQHHLNSFTQQTPYDIAKHRPTEIQEFFGIQPQPSCCLIL